MRHRYAIAVIVGGLLCAALSRAQIITLKRSGGKTITCVHTGLTSDQMPCGTMGDWYTYVFIGQIASIAPAANGEKTLQIDPEEIFRGDPHGPLTVLTSQVACLPPLRVGDQWLFYLGKEQDKPIILDYYENDSVPVAEAQEQIKTLRRLQDIGNRGIVRGVVRRGSFGTGSPVAGAELTARGGPGDQRYAASSNKDGRYEFPPLPAGSYKITADSIGGFQPDSTSLDVTRGSCWNLTLDRVPHGQISGFVRYSDGSPVKGADVMLVSADGSFVSMEVDKHGHFEFDSQEAGKYFVGVMAHGKTKWETAGGSGPPPSGLLYYPNTPDRSAAEVIDLRRDEKRRNIDFTIPAR